MDGCEQTTTYTSVLNIDFLNGVKYMTLSVCIRYKEVYMLLKLSFVIRCSQIEFECLVVSKKATRGYMLV